jgi:hypothetical protein
MYRLLPKIGPLRPLKFEAPTQAAEALFLQSLKETTDRYRSALLRLRSGRLDLANTDFDTSRPAVSGEYPLADETYAELLDRLERGHFATVSPALRQNIVSFYKPIAAPGNVSNGSNGNGGEKDRKKETKRERKIRRQLEALRARVQ